MKNGRRREGSLLDIFPPEARQSPSLTIFRRLVKMEQVRWAFNLFKKLLQFWLGIGDLYSFIGSIFCVFVIVFHCHIVSLPISTIVPEREVVTIL